MDTAVGHHLAKESSGFPLENANLHQVTWDVIRFDSLAGQGDGRVANRINGLFYLGLSFRREWRMAHSTFGNP
jgi:hypothetical protein